MPTSTATKPKTPAKRTAKAKAAPVRVPVVNENLDRGDVFEFRGKEYLIVKRGTTRYHMVDRAGRAVSLPMIAPIIVIENSDWTLDGDEAAAKVLNRNVPAHKFESGDPCIIQGRGARELAGKTGWVVKVNPATTQVLIPNVGVFNASHSMVKPVA